MTRPEGSVLIWWRRCCRSVVRRGASVYRVADARSADLKSAVSQVCNLRIVGKIGRLGSDRCPADYKSAIRQIENLRYGKHIRRGGGAPTLSKSGHYRPEETGEPGTEPSSFGFPSPFGRRHSAFPSRHAFPATQAPLGNEADQREEKHG